jgi:hypothetical protein
MLQGLALPVPKNSDANRRLGAGSQCIMTCIDFHMDSAHTKLGATPRALKP